MKNARKIGSRLIALALALVMLMGFTAQALAAPVIVTDDGDVITRISNPEGAPGEADGLIGDREISYGWCITERDGYLYIGGWRNTVGLILKGYVENTVVASGMMDSEKLWDLIDLLTNGEVPHPTTRKGGILLKMDRNDPGNFEIVADLVDPFRTAVKYGDELYFASYVAASGNPAGIFKLDKDDNLTQIYSTVQGTSMRASCIYDGGLYFGGTMADKPVEEGEPVELTIIKKHENDDGWDQVADKDDFCYTYLVDDGCGSMKEETALYANDAALTNAAASPIWELSVYNDYIYCTLPGATGFVVFKGHPAQEDETANKYGWCWTEIIGRDMNSPNNQGLHDENKYGYTDYPGLRSVAASLAVFNGQLYAYDFDHTMNAMLSGVKGLFSLLANPEGTDLEQYLKPLYVTLTHPQRLWVMDNDTETFTEVEGVTELTAGTTNEYIWKHGVYNGELYIGTMDSKVGYNYLTRITGGSLFEMTYEEFCRQINYIVEFIKKYARGEAEEEEIEEFIDELEEDLTEGGDTTAEEQELISDFLEKLSATLIDIGTYAGTSGMMTTLSLLMTHDLINEEQLEQLMTLLAQLDGIDEMEKEEKEALVAELTAFLGSMWENIKTMYEEDPESLRLTEEDMASIKSFFTQLTQYAVSTLENQFSEELEEVRHFVRVVQLYMTISEFVRNDTQGFDIYKSADGVNWQVVTDDGFGDKFNYGARTFFVLEEGMYITTANPFYGTQLYLLSNNKGADVVGDLNGDGRADNRDIIMLARRLVNLEVFDEETERKADVNGDGEITNTDLVLLAKMMVGIG